MNIPSHCRVTENFPLYSPFFFFFLFPLVGTGTSAVHPDRTTHKHMEVTREILVWRQPLSSVFCSSCAWRTSGHSSRCAMTSLAFVTASCSTPLTCLMSGTSARWVQCFRALLWPRRISCMWTSTTFNICSYQGCVWIIKLFGGTV